MEEYLNGKPAEQFPTPPSDLVRGSSSDGYGYNGNGQNGNGQNGNGQNGSPGGR